MNHLYNADAEEVPIYEHQGLIIGRPKATQCMTAEQLEALNIVGIYENIPDSDTPKPTTTGVLPRVVPKDQTNMGVNKERLAEGSD